MKWQRARQSQNIDDRRGGGRGAARAGGVGIGGLAIALIAGWFLGVNPAEILSLLGGVQGSGTSAPSASSPEDEAARPISEDGMVLV